MRLVMCVLKMALRMNGSCFTHTTIVDTCGTVAGLTLLLCRRRGDTAQKNKRPPGLDADSAVLSPYLLMELQ